MRITQYLSPEMRLPKAILGSVDKLASTRILGYFDMFIIIT